MKLSAADSASFWECIDEAYRPEQSIVLRYRRAVRFAEADRRDLAFKELLGASSLREGARIVPLMTWKGVDIHLLDESSGMETGSIKAIDGCLTAALCRLEGTGRIVFESGGNTGAALTRYGRQVGLETFFFCPADNLDLLDSRLFVDRGAHLVAVGPRERVKEFAGLFAERAGIRRLPEKSWRYVASWFRGLHLLEQILAGNRFDWISQTVSAAFGPIGIYQVLAAFEKEIGNLPRFLGVQQKANCPMYAAWKPAAGGGNDETAGRLLTRVMYDRSPQTYRTFPDLQQVLRLSRGDLLTVDEAEFACLRRPDGDGSVLDLLRSRGVEITRRSGEVVEKTGLIALAGVLKAIDAGTVPAGSRVLCCLTGGVSAADGRARPELTLGTPEEVLAYVGQVGRGG